MRRIFGQLLVVVTTASLVGCDMEGSYSEPSRQDVTAVARARFMTMADRSSVGATVTTTSAPLGAHLNYYGGKLIQNVRVSQVLYGSGTYIPELTSASGVNMASAYNQMLTSGAFDWLMEYNITSPAQSIGRGSFAGSHQIVPAASRDGQTIDDADIQAEIAAQIQAGVLPPPDDNQLYMLHFPSGKSIVGPDGSKSCVLVDPTTGLQGFCGYHGTFQIGSQNVYYGVLPALTDAACPVHCQGGTHFTPFQNQQGAASHELVEAVTDAEAGLAGTIGPPLAWYDPNWGEIGDICNGQLETFTGTDQATYTIQKEYSNSLGDCVTEQEVFGPPLPNIAGSSGILWRCTPPDSTTPCGAAVAGSTAIWHDAIAGSTSYPGAVDFGWQIQGVGNFDGDGVDDILWRSVNGDNVIWFDGVAPGLWISPLGGGWKFAGIGDFDGDHTSDILWRCAPSDSVTPCGGVPAGSTAIWHDANAGWTTYPGAVGFDWQIQGVGDFDGDGLSDIFWRSVNGDNVIWFGGVAPGLWIGPLNDGWQFAGIGDFDGNHESDILWRCNPAGHCGDAVGGSTAIWNFANGNYGWTTFPGALDGNWQIQGVGDFDSNHNSDILWRCVPQAPATSCGHAVAGATAVWTFSNGNVGGTAWPGVLDFNWQIQAVGKFD